MDLHPLVKTPSSMIYRWKACGRWFAGSLGSDSSSGRALTTLDVSRRLFLKPGNRLSCLRDASQTAAPSVLPGVENSMVEQLVEVEDRSTGFVFELASDARVSRVRKRKEVGRVFTVGLDTGGDLTKPTKEQDRSGAK